MGGESILEGEKTPREERRGEGGVRKGGMGEKEQGREGGEVRAGGEREGRGAGGGMGVEARSMFSWVSRKKVS